MKRQISLIVFFTIYITVLSQGVVNNPKTLEGITKVMMFWYYEDDFPKKEYEKYGLSVDRISNYLTNYLDANGLERVSHTEFTSKIGYTEIAIRFLEFENKIYAFKYHFRFYRYLMDDDLVYRHALVWEKERFGIVGIKYFWQIEQDIMKLIDQFFVDFKEGNKKQ